MRGFNWAARLFHRRCSHFPINSNQLTNSSYVITQIEAFLSHQFPTLQSLQQSHSLIVVTGNASNPFIAAKLVSLYGLILKPACSIKVFDNVLFKDVFLWNTIIKSHFSSGDFVKTIVYYQKMRLSNYKPDNFTIPMVVSACAELLNLDYGKIVHGLVKKLGTYGGDSATASALLYMYFKCGRVGDAAKVFDAMPVIDVVAWTALVIGYVQNGENEKGLEHLSDFHRVGVGAARLNSRTLEGGFQACGNLSALMEGKSLHGLVIKSGFSCAYVIRSSILSMYTKCGAEREACSSFREVEDKDLVCWTSILSVYAQLRCSVKCLSLFREMQDVGVCPDDIAISCLISSFHDRVQVREGKAFHGLIFRRNYAMSRRVHSALMAMYCRFEMLSIADKIFDRDDISNLGSWNMMVVRHAKVGDYKTSMDIFREMQNLRIKCDSESLACVISSCSQLGVRSLGLSAHSFAIKNLMCEDDSVSNSLIYFYGKYGKLDTAKRIFDRTQRGTVSWNTLISVHAHMGHSQEAIALFDRMVSENSYPNSATLVMVLSACSSLGSLEQGERIHNYIVLEGINTNLSLATALMDMYGKCGQLEKSRLLFNSINEKDIISWNVMISCYGMHGDAQNAINLFKEMESSGIEPTGVTFLALLSACNHGGLVKEGRLLFSKMRKYSLTPTLKHYACMVDLLAKSGSLQEAENMVLLMPVAPDGGIWGTLLTACNIQNEVEVGMRVFKRAVEADPANDGYYIIMSSLFDAVGKWKEAEKIRELMKSKGVRKIAGWSAL